MDQRRQFITDYQRGLQSVTELADRFDIRRKTAYTWIDRPSPPRQNPQRHELVS